MPLGRPRWLARTTRAPFVVATRIVGRVSRMRVSSVTRTPSSGTLKSTRMKTRRPRSVKSLMESFFCMPRHPARQSRDEILAACALRRRPPEGTTFPPHSEGRKARNQRLQPGRHEPDQVHAAAAVAPLVVVPGQDLHAAISDDLGKFRIHDGGVRGAFEVRGGQLLLGIGEDALHGAFGGGAESGIPTGDGSRL